MSGLQAVEKENISYRYFCIPPEQAPMVWPDVYNMLKPAVDHTDGRWSMDSLLHALCTGAHHLWIAQNSDGEIEAAMTTQIAQYPHARMLCISFLGGSNYDLWKNGWMEELEECAKRMGCTGLESIARKGFAKLMKEYGYDHKQYFFTKILDGEQ